MTEENSHAGQGAVLLDIGGTVGALVIYMPEGLEGVEIEARPRIGAGHSHDRGRPHHRHAQDHDAHNHQHLPFGIIFDRRRGQRVRSRESQWLPG